MKKTTLINAPLSGVIAGMGHTDGLCVADAGLPIPVGLPRVDLALTRGLPSFLDTIRVVLAELEVEGALLAREIKVKNPRMLEELRTVLGDSVTLEFVAHKEFKVRSRDCVAAVRTGEFSPCANVILFAGVVF